MVGRLVGTRLTLRFFFVVYYTLLDFGNKDGTAGLLRVPPTACQRKPDAGRRLAVIPTGHTIEKLNHNGLSGGLSEASRPALTLAGGGCVATERSEVRNERNAEKRPKQTG